MKDYSDTTRLRLRQQIQAMGCAKYEIGVSDPAKGMLIRVWDSGELERSLQWLRHENAHGSDIYIRPDGSQGTPHALSLVDDLTRESIEEMKETGFHPALVLETSPGNFQAWLKHHEALDQETSTAVARFLAGMFDGDVKSADWRHFGRLAGFTNSKPQYQSASTGLYPYVRLLGAEGAVYPRSEELIAEVRHDMDVRFEHRMEARKKELAHQAACNEDEERSLAITQELLHIWGEIV